MAIKNKQPNQKITDEHFLKCYNNGMGDREIARKFKMNHSSIQHKRIIKFELKPNKKSYSGKEMDIPSFKRKRLFYLKRLKEKYFQKNKPEAYNYAKKYSQSKCYKLLQEKLHPFKLGSNQHKKVKKNGNK